MYIKKFFLVTNETALHVLRRISFIYLSNKNLFKKLKKQIPMLSSGYQFEKSSSHLSKHWYFNLYEDKYLLIAIIPVILFRKIELEIVQWKNQRMIEKRLSLECIE